VKERHLHPPPPTTDSLQYYVLKVVHFLRHMRCDITSQELYCRVLTAGSQCPENALIDLRY
jgi:hypothetical protein